MDSHCVASLNQQTSNWISESVPGRSLLSQSLGLYIFYYFPLGFVVVVVFLVRRLGLRWSHLLHLHRALPAATNWTKRSTQHDAIITGSYATEDSTQSETEFASYELWIAKPKLNQSLSGNSYPVILGLFLARNS